ncbi:MAG: hypothetical protein WAS73_01850 [Defluviicoccus sp.]
MMINDNEARLLHVMKEELAARQRDSTISQRDLYGHPVPNPGGAAAFVRSVIECFPPQDQGERPRLPLYRGNAGTR